jgi:probable 2-oxoglutarate dehydrogenase E1 component DHKTD1
MSQPASSSITEMKPGTRFQPVLPDPLDNKQAVSVVMLSGKIYYELIKERQARNLNDKIAFIRIEELAPFPFEALEEVLNLYPWAIYFAWLQEEPQNQGAWNHVRSRIETVRSARHLSNGVKLRYLGREKSALPAPGIGTLYQKQQRSVIESAFSLWTKESHSGRGSVVIRNGKILSY